ncbi:hypothetical protein ADL15_04140 [Actinoplanes awajinensis subsp. mycoplanecinus]|uniref:SecDF P1 head subdomain domain-containing protein n=1 Tax=Actinoplanes awajinensis subsp. mycoplanecinus TaxID=135947 RepID=A0A0X3V9N3_9ACTN|nr:hypothetical protein ADL15_04140 [Actinoplanes awajinensis subsp. mycoplanecinus]
MWRAVVLGGAAGTAIGLIGKIPVLGLVAGLVSVIGVVGLLIAQRTPARSAHLTASDRPAPEASPGRPARRWVWVVAAVVVAAAAALLLVRPWQDDQSAEPQAAREPLGFYLVQGITPGACAPNATAPQYTTTDGSGCLTVSAEGGFTVRQLDEVQVQDQSDQGNGWAVSVTFADQDTARFTDLTRRASALPEPRNQLAIVLGTRVLSNPTVLEPLTGATAVITTQLDQAGARTLAGELGAR